MPGCDPGVRGGDRDASERKGPQRQPQQRLDRRLEEVAQAVGGGYCRLQMPLRPALGVRGTVAGRPRGGGSPLQCISLGREVPHHLLCPQAWRSSGSSPRIARCCVCPHLLWVAPRAPGEWAGVWPVLPQGFAPPPPPPCPEGLWASGASPWVVFVSTVIVRCVAGPKAQLAPGVGPISLFFGPPPPHHHRSGAPPSPRSTALSPRLPPFLIWAKYFSGCFSSSSSTQTPHCKGKVECCPLGDTTVLHQTECSASCTEQAARQSPTVFAGTWDPLVPTVQLTSVPGRPQFG